MHLPSSHGIRSDKSLRNTLTFATASATTGPTQSVTRGTVTPSNSDKRGAIGARENFSSYPPLGLIYSILHKVSRQEKIRKLLRIPRSRFSQIGDHMSISIFHSRNCFTLFLHSGGYAKL